MKGFFMMKKYHRILLLAVLLAGGTVAHAEEPAAKPDTQSRLQQTTHGREMLKRTSGDSPTRRAVIAVLRSLIGQ